MTYRPARTLFGLIAVGGAVAVGVTTHDAGFTALTFVGGLLLPRVLGIRFGGGFAARACAGGRHEQMRARFDSRMGDWHRRAHESGAPSGPPAAPAGV